MLRWYLNSPLLTQRADFYKLQGTPGQDSIAWTQASGATTLRGYLWVATRDETGFMRSKEALEAGQDTPAVPEITMDAKTA